MDRLASIAADANGPAGMLRVYGTGGWTACTDPRQATTATSTSKFPLFYGMNGHMAYPTGVYSTMTAAQPARTFEAATDFTEPLWSRYQSVAAYQGIRYVSAS